MNKHHSIQFEKFEEKDVKEVLEFWQSIPGIYLHQNGEDSVEGIIQYLRRNPGFSHVAKAENRIIGALMCGHDGRRGLIHHLGVDQNYRKMVIAKKLLDLSLEKLRSVNIRKCVIFVLKGNKEAKKFYEHLGWVSEQKADIYSLLLNINIK
jgi:putative acetyltransferase